MIGSDLVIGTHDVMAYTWGGCILASVAGLWLKGNNNRANTLAASVFTSLVFFVITNFGVWLSWYPHTGAGLTECFVKAIPFLRNTMAANLIGTIVLFEGYKICQRTFADSKYKAILLAE
jgi:hypothetical protein